MRRRGGLTAVVALTVVVGVGVTGSVAGAEGPSGGHGGGGGQFQFGDSDEVLLSEEVPDFSGGTGPPPGYVLDLVHGLSPEGTDYENTDACWGIVLAEPGEGRPWDEVYQQQQDFDDPLLYGACPVELTFDLDAYVLRSWQTLVAPPPPTPVTVNNGHGAITGLTSYLEIGGDPRPTQIIPNPIGPDITITMIPRYVVDWGDGTIVETTSQGGPAPHSDLSHVYLDVGGVTVTVEAYWHATWTAGAIGGDLPELPVPTADSEALDVEQWQAVIDG